MGLKKKQTILLGRQLTDPFLPLPGDQMQLAQIRGWHERPSQQTRTSVANHSSSPTSVFLPGTIPHIRPRGEENFRIGTLPKAHPSL
jgi:hypothetical protein